MYSIFANVASTYAPQFATMAQGIAFAKRLLEGFLTGFGIATAVSLLVFPLTSRTMVFKTSTAYIGALRAALKAQSRYLVSLESKDVFSTALPVEKNTSDEKGEHHLFHHQAKPAISQPSPEAKALKTAVASLGELHGKINSQLTFAKREVAYGNLDAADLSEVSKLLRQVMLPIIGMSSVAGVYLYSSLSDSCRAHVDCGNKDCYPFRRHRSITGWYLDPKNWLHYN